MASITVGDVESCLLGKLQAVNRAGKHRKFLIYDDQGILIAETHLSHAFRRRTQLDNRLLGDIRRQLKLPSSRDLELLIECTMTRNAYLDLASR